MCRILLLSLLFTITSAINGVGNGAGNGNGNGSANGNKLGFAKFDSALAASSFIGVQVGDCTITSVSSEVCSEGLSQSFTLTNKSGEELSYKCTCPALCVDGNAGTGAYTCSVTSENYSESHCGDIDIAAIVLNRDGGTCMIAVADGAIICEEDCYCDGTKHSCVSEGESCCAGMCQKVSGKGVKGKYELQCLAVATE
jgi:hypothetical protein